jgi:DNA-binding winged helix-turn-helix (wHTH) protein
LTLVAGANKRSGDQRLIKTIPRRGYLLDAVVSSASRAERRSPTKWSLISFAIDLKVYQLLLATFERSDEPPRLVAPARPGLLWI